VKGHAQAGQTLLVFALCAAFVMLGLLALVGDNAVLQVHYNKIDEAAVLAVQAASAEIDVPEFTATHTVRLSPEAENICRDVARLNQPTSAHATCTLSADRSSVRVDISDTGAYIVGFFGPGFTIHATHVGKPAYGISKPCMDPRDPASC
jgi:hypothetical protein